MGVSALLNELPVWPPRGPLLYPMAMWVFLIYSVVVALRKRAHAGVFGLLALFGDTIFFLILANHGTGRSIWFASVFFLYIVVEGLAFYGPREVFLVVAISSAFCALAPSPQLALIERVVLAAGTVAIGFSINKDRLERQVQSLKAEAEAARETALKAAEAERQRI